MMSYTKSMLVWVLTGVAMISHANEPALITERARLENVITELNHLQNYMNETEQSVKHNAKAKFNFDAFEADLNLLKDGIKRYLNYHSTRPSQPKTNIQPVNGEYRT